MSNKATDEQIAKLARLAQEYAGGHVGIMLDADTKGDEGAKELLWKLHEQDVNASLVWSRNKHGGSFKDREPESLYLNEWERLQREEADPAS